MTTELTGIALGLDSAPLEQGAQRAEQALDKVGKKAQDVQKNLKETTKETEKSIKVAEQAGTAIGNVVGKLAGFAASYLSIRALVSEAVAFEKQNIRLEAQMRRLGDAAESTKQQMGDFADELSRVSGFDDDAIKGAEIALRELGVRSQPAVQGITQLGVALSGLKPELGGVEEVSRMLGRALEKPAEATRVLRQLNIGLAESTMQQIEAMAKSGKTAEASALMYSAVGEAIGGVDKAISSNLNSIDGRARQLATTWGNLVETVSHSKPFNDLSQIILVGLSKVIVGAKHYTEEFLATVQRVVYFAEAHNPANSADQRATAQGLLNQANSETLNRAAEYEKSLNDIATGGVAAGEGQKKAALGAKDFAGFSKNAAEAAAKQAGATKDLLGSLRLETDEYENLTVALKNGLPYHDRMKATLDAEKKAREAGIDVHSKLGQQYTQEAIKLGNVKGAYEELKKQVEETDNKTKEFYNNLQSDLQDNIVNSLSGEQTFGKMFENMVSGFKKSLLKMQVEALLNPIFLDIKSQVTGGSIGLGSSSGTGNIFSLFGGGGGGISTGGIGGFLDNIFSGSSSGITAGVADPEFGFMGQLGAKGVGGVANGGGFLSSIFGSGGGFGGSIFGAGGTSFGTVLGNSGYGFIGSTASQLLGLSGGGTGSSIGGTIGSIGGSAIGGPIGSIVGSFLGSTIGGLFDGGEAKYQEAVKQRELSKQRDQFSQGDMAAFLQLGTSTTATGKAIADLTANFDALKKKAEEFGLSTSLLQNQFTNLKKKITEDFDASITAAINALNNDPTSQLKALKDAQQQRIKEAIDAEGNLANVRKLNALELQKFYDGLTSSQAEALGGLISAADVLKTKLKDLTATLSSALSEQLNTVTSYAREQRTLEATYKNISSSLTQAIQGLRGGSLSTLSPVDILGEQRALFSSAAARAKGGDTAALASLPQLAQTLLTSSKAYNASSETYARDFEMVQGALEKAGITSGTYGDLAVRQATLAEAQVKILGQIRDNLSGETPDQKLLSQQVAALKVLSGLTEEGNVTGETQVQKLVANNAIQEALNTIIKNDGGTSKDILDALSGANAGQVILISKIVEGNANLSSILGSYFKMQSDLAAAEAKKKAEQAAQAAKQAQIDAKLSNVRGSANSIANRVKSVTPNDFTENLHEWVVQFNPVTGKKIFDMAGDRGGAEQKVVSDQFFAAISPATQAIAKALGFKNAPNVFYQLGTKYNSGANVGGVRDNGGLGYNAFGINDFQSIFTDIVTKIVQSGSGGDKRLVDYAKGLNWSDFANSLTSVEQKAIDLGLRHFATGGSFMVGGSGGVDSQRVSFMASPNERVTVKTPAQFAQDNQMIVDAVAIQTNVLAQGLSGLQSQVNQLSKEMMLDRESRRRSA